jgi:hypothetical protein
MWARVVEFMLGCWLAISPFIFRHPADDRTLWVTDWVSAGLVILFALLSYWPPLKSIHLATLLVALVLVVVGRLSSWEHPPPGAQNQIVVGLLLLMFALVPSHASHPPPAWDEPRDDAPLHSR